MKRAPRHWRAQDVREGSPNEVAAPQCGPDPGQGRDGSDRQKGRQRRQIARELNGPGRRADKPDRPKDYKDHQPGAPPAKDNDAGQNKSPKSQDSTHTGPTGKDVGQAGDSCALEPIARRVGRITSPRQGLLACWPDSSLTEPERLRVKSTSLRTEGIDEEDVFSVANVIVSIWRPLVAVSGAAVFVTLAHPLHVRLP